MRSKYAIAILTALTVIILASGTATAQDNVCSWRLVGKGTNLVPAYPDTHTEYYLFSHVAQQTSWTTIFRVTGQYPYARLSSFQAYDSTSAVSDTLADFEIRPDAGNVNPAQKEINRYSENRSFTVWYVSPEIAQMLSPEEYNIVTIQSGDVPYLIMRVLRHDPVQPLPLPSIEVFDATTGAPIPCPDKGIVTYNPAAAAAPVPPIGNKEVHFYRFSGQGHAPNSKTVYLGTRINDTNLVKLRFPVPVFPDTYNDQSAVFTGQEDVRYAGICVHGLSSTLASECLADDEIVVGQDGFATVIVGPPNEFLRGQAHSLGYNYLGWGQFKEPLLLYRQVLSADNFVGSATLVPEYSSEIPPEQQWADTYIGAYAPKGEVIKVIR